MMAAGELTRKREAVRSRAFQSISDTSNYTETQINRAIRQAINKEPDILDDLFEVSCTEGYGNIEKGKRKGET